MTSVMVGAISSSQSSLVNKSPNGSIHCASGERAAPPDDVGSVPGYVNFLEAIGDPKHPEHRDILIWIGGTSDPNGFDLNAINRTLRFGGP
jgi:hypothetical protein